ncbi:MAG: CAP domain-containing protein [Patescibacteria group bacterium]
MLQLFKKYFIPHQYNSHQPHILRRRALFAILSLVLLAEVFFLLQIFLISPLTGIFSSVLPNVLIELTNGDRLQKNLQPLKTNARLEHAALLKAKDMAEKGYFEHLSPDGKTPWSWLEQTGYDYQWAGENLAVNFVDSKDIEDAWMNSAGHRANILDVHFTEIGIAALPGVYKNKPAIFVVQFFGLPVSTTQSSISKTPSPTPLASPVIRPEPAMTIVKESASTSLMVAGTIEGLANSRTKAPAASIFNKILAMPKTALSYFYLAIALMVLLALGLKIFVRIKVQYPKLIFNGVFILFVIISISYLNYLIIAQGKVF